MVELIQAAKTQGIPVYWVSTTSQANIDAVLQALAGQVERADFERIFTKDDVDQAKPNPQVYQMALEVAGVEVDKVLAIEDTLDNQQAARAAGIECMLFPGEYARVVQGQPVHRLSGELLEG